MNAIKPVGLVQGDSDNRACRTWLEYDGRRTTMGSASEFGLQFNLAGRFERDVFLCLMVPFALKDGVITGIVVTDSDDVYLRWALSSETPLGTAAPRVVRAIRQARAVHLSSRNFDNEVIQEGTIPLVVD